jgi:hypothetical protein
VGLFHFAYVPPRFVPMGGICVRRKRGETTSAVAWIFAFGWASRTLVTSFSAFLGDEHRAPTLRGVDTSTGEAHHRRTV